MNIADRDWLKKWIRAVAKGNDQGDTLDTAEQVLHVLDGVEHAYRQSDDRRTRRVARRLRRVLAEPEAMSVLLAWEDEEIFGA